MHFSLVVIGAHNGSKLAQTIAQGRAAGNVLLVEPVPFLFRMLELQYADQPGVFLRNLCIAPKDGTASFVAPLPSASVISDQLGSLLPNHAITHDPALAAHIETIEVAARTFGTLIDELQIDAIDLLYCDTEGMDVQLLDMFPFEALMPQKIVFESTHTDGTFRIGRRLGSFLIRLDDIGYRSRILDAENILTELVATPVATPAAKPAAGKMERMLRFLLRS